MENHKYLGSVLSLQEKSAEALQHFKDALDTYLRLTEEDKEEEASDPIELYNAIAEIHVKQNDIAQAVDYYIKSAKAYEAENGEFEKSLADQYTRISKLYQQINKAKESSEYKEKAEDILARLNPAKSAQETKKGVEVTEKKA